MMRRSDCAALTLLLAVVPYFVLVVNRPGRPGGRIAFDIYNYYYPNILYALETLRHGGKGLWWNALLNCGQPFFGNSFTGLLYPANIFWLLLEPDTALRTVIGFNMLVAGFSAYALGRVLGCGVVAALCGALAFELGNATVGFSMWGPQVSGSYVWLPAALLGCERLLQRPSFGRAVFLGTVLAIALLPGFPQVVLFTYQLIALRVVWEFATRRPTQPMRTILWLGLGLLLPPFLIAVQFLPGLEVADVSVRNAALSGHELVRGGGLDWRAFRRAVTLRSSPISPLILIPCIVAGAALWQRTTRRHGLFYLLAGLLYLVLGFGPNTPLFQAYAALPFGRLFREPERFIWMSGFCLAVLTALGTEALLSQERLRGKRIRVGVAVTLGLVALGYHLLLLGGFRLSEWLLAGAVVSVSVAVLFVPASRRWATPVIVTAVLANLLLVHRATLQRLLDDGGRLLEHRDVFAALQQQMTAQDRVYLIPVRQPDFSFEMKTASLFGVPSLQDYEPMPTRRYAEFFVMLRTGEEMRSLNRFYYPLEGFNPPGFKRRLLDVAAGRYVIAARAADQTARVIAPPPRMLTRYPALTVYENPQALPRAFYVPRVEVVADARGLLRRMAYGTDDLRHLALVEEPPQSGFLGLPDNDERGSAEFTRNDPEQATIRVRAPARGFLFLGDQYFPGWHATVNGTAVPIQRANYLFRLVEVPEGESVVDFRYTPGSVRLGAVISALTLLSLGIAGAYSFLRRRT